MAIAESCAFWTLRPQLSATWMRPVSERVRRVSRLGLKVQRSIISRFGSARSLAETVCAPAGTLAHGSLLAGSAWTTGVCVEVALAAPPSPRHDDADRVAAVGGADAVAAARGAVDGGAAGAGWSHCCHW